MHHIVARYKDQKYYICSINDLTLAETIKQIYSYRFIHVNFKIISRTMGKIELSQFRPCLDLINKYQKDHDLGVLINHD